MWLRWPYCRVQQCISLFLSFSTSSFSAFLILFFLFLEITFSNVIYDAMEANVTDEVNKIKFIDSYYLVKYFFLHYSSTGIRIIAFNHIYKPIYLRVLFVYFSLCSYVKRILQTLLFSIRARKVFIFIAILSRLIFLSHNCDTFAKRWTLTVSLCFVFIDKVKQSKRIIFIAWIHHQTKKKKPLIIYMDVKMRQREREVEEINSTRRWINKLWLLLSSNALWIYAIWMFLHIQNWTHFFLYRLMFTVIDSWLFISIVVSLPKFKQPRN